jgi:cellulose synthase operon protein YhjQ
MSTWDGAETPDDGTADRKGSGRGRFAAGTPEDVAALYTWANLQGAGYKDFSASRRRYREKIRKQAAEGNVAPPELPRQAQAAAAAGESSLEERRRGGSAIRWAANQRSWESSSRSIGEAQMAPGQAQVSSGMPTFGPAEPPTRPAVAADGRIVGIERYQAVEAVPETAEKGWQHDRELAGVNDDPLYRSYRAPGEEDRWERIDPHSVEVEESFASTPRGMETELRRDSGTMRMWEPEPADQEPEFEGPAWLYGKAHEPVRSRIHVRPGFEPAMVEAPRPAVVHRWSALREVVDSEWIVPRESRASAAVGRRAPLLIVFSMAGGVGRTSLLATVGRALSSSGERVLLGDAAPYSLLPFFFGGNELRPGEMRRFAPAEDSGDSPIFLVNYDLARAAGDLNEQKHLVSEILRSGAECHRILLDLPMGSDWLLRRLATLQATVLVPLLPDLSSVVSLEAIERYFERFADEDGNPVLPFYVLSQFDASQKLHLDVRDLLRGRLGERLLDFVVRRSTAVSEALAEGMTVADYAPESAVARDYLDLAVWLRTVSPPVLSGMRTARSGRE